MTVLGYYSIYEIPIRYFSLIVNGVDGGRKSFSSEGFVPTPKRSIPPILDFCFQRPVTN